MFDAAERMVVCNDLYIEMYGLSREIVKPGCSFLEVLQCRAAAGSFLHHDPETYRAEVMTELALGKVATRIFETADGREVLMTNSPWLAVAGLQPIRTSPSGEEQKRRLNIWRTTMR